MPNHVTNKIALKGDPERIKEFVERFSTIIPEHNNKTHDGSIICSKKDGSGSCGWYNEETNKFSVRGDGEMIVTDGMNPGYEFDVVPETRHFPDFEKVIPQPENIFRGDLGEKEREMCAREGRPNWYDWNHKNWGTKWNSYMNKKVEYEDNTYVFDTAWSPVPGIVSEMSKLFPDVEIAYEYSDEDMGYNCGIYIFKDGEIAEENILDGGTNEAYELALKLHPEYADELILVDGNYVWKDELEEEDDKD